MTKKYISDAPNAPKAIGPYSQAVVAAPFAFLSGQLGIDPATGKLAGDAVEVQAEQTLKNIRAVLAHLKLELSDVVKTTIFLMNLGDFQAVNKLYGDAFGELKPARSTIQVAALPLGAKIEIEVVAAIR